MTARATLTKGERIMSDLDAVEILTAGPDYRVRIVHDEDPMSPRDADNVGVMACRHRRYTLGDSDFPERSSVERAWEALDARTFARWARAFLGATVVLPLYLLDHSGLSMTAGQDATVATVDRRRAFGADPGGWDTSVVGFIFDTPRTRETTGAEPGDVEACLRGEVEECDRYLQGDVYGYIVERAQRWAPKGDPDGDDELVTWHEEESCWGFIGREYAEQSAREALESAAGVKVEG